MKPVHLTSLRALALLPFALLLGISGADAASTKPAPKPAAKPAAAAAQDTSYGDWRYVCPAPVAPGGVGCSIIQQLTDNKTGNVLMLWRLTKAGEALVSDWQTPTGVLVNRGFTLNGVAQKPVAIPFTACMPTNCEAVINFAPDLVAALGTATTISGTLVAVNGQPLTFNFSAKGLPDALAALQK